MKALIQRHRLLIYFILAFAISWGGILISVGPGGLVGTTKPTDSQLPFVYLAMLAGPSIAGILLIGLIYGRQGFQDVLFRLLTWRVKAKWYAMALLTAPLLMIVILLALSFLSVEFLPGIVVARDKASLLLTGILAGVVVGFFEELGWTGFAAAELRQRYSILVTGLIVGFLWGAWHYPVFSSGDSSGAISPALFLPVLLFTHLPAYRVLMIWVYDRTESLFVTMLMHASYTSGILIIQPLEVAGVRAITYNLTLTASLWVVVALVAKINKGQLSGQPLQRQVA